MIGDVVEEITKLETEINVWFFKFFWRTELELKLELTERIATLALERNILSELEEKDETFFCWSSCNTRIFCTMWETKF